MFKYLKNKIKEEHAGFSGITHWLIAIFLFFLMWLIPWAISRDYIIFISSNIIYAVLVFFVIGGASLLPDLDSSPLQEGGSTAVYQLGLLGQGLSILAITISGVIYSLFHTRYDEKPKSQHRMLFHTFLIPAMIFLFSIYLMPNSNDQLKNNLNIDSVIMFVSVFFAGISVYLGGSMLFYKILSLVGMQSKTQILSLICMAASVIYMAYMPYRELRMIGIAIALGYTFHILGDLITKGSSPIFFPIPTFKNRHMIMWRKPYLFGGTFAITTGGIINIILNFVLMGSNVFLAWYIFIK